MSQRPNARHGPTNHGNGQRRQRGAPKCHVPATPISQGREGRGRPRATRNNEPRNSPTRREGTDKEKERPRRGGSDELTKCGSTKSQPKPPEGTEPEHRSA